MTCPSCGAPTTSGSCQKCASKPSGWGGAFNSWGSGASGSGEWGEAVKAPSAGTALATLPGPAEGWGNLPLASDQTSWGEAPTLASPSAPVSAGRSGLYQPDNWDSPGPALDPAEDQQGWSSTTAATAAAPRPQAELEEETGEGWLNSGGGSIFANPTTPPPTPSWEEDEHVEDAWLDEEPDSELEAPPSAPAQGGGALLWVAALATTLLVLVGFWALNKSPQPAALAASGAKEVAAESLKDGRRLVVTGKETVKTDPEMAALQFREAIPKLKSGGAAAEEIQDTRRMQANALMVAGDYKEAHAVWNQLRSAGALKELATAGVLEANRALRKTAGAALRDAEGALKADQPRQAERLALEAFELYSAHGGNQEQLGNAAGALGLAHYKQNHKTDARRYLEHASSLVSNSAYAGPLGELRLVTSEPEVAVRAPDPEPVEVRANIGGDEELYPVGGAPRPGGGKKKPGKPAPVAAEEAVKPQPKAPKVAQSPPPKPKPPKRHQKDDTLKTY